MLMIVKLVGLASRRWVGNQPGSQVFRLASRAKRLKNQNNDGSRAFAHIYLDAAGRSLALVPRHDQDHEAGAVEEALERAPASRQGRVGRALREFP